MRQSVTDNNQLNLFEGQVESNLSNNRIDLGDLDSTSIVSSISSSSSSSSYLLSSNPIPSHYVDVNTEGENLYESVLSGDTQIDLFESYSTFPLFFEKSNCIMIPKKVKRLLTRNTTKDQLKEIHPDTQTAIELCLIFVANLSNTFYLEKKWKPLQKNFLQEQVGSKSDLTYLKIRKLLEVGTEKKGPVIEVDHDYTIGEQSKLYCLTKDYYGKGIELYELKTDYAKDLRRKAYFKAISRAIDNKIAKNLINLYSIISFPTEQEIVTEAKRLVSLGHKNKKGKLLTFQYNHKKEYWKDFEDRSFVELNIKLFNVLTNNGTGFLIPTISEGNAGGRVVDSLSLMPSWIRALLKVDSKTLVECDFSAFHPNLAVNIYQGSKEYITHAEVAEYLNIPIQEAKVEHLSFFNKEWAQMHKSPLFKYYSELQPGMMQNIYNDKKENGHKSTSRKMFSLEVEIMTEVIAELNSKEIYVVYIYDALACMPEHKEIVIETMNRVALSKKVYTVANKLFSTLHKQDNQ
jgi:hypothetical protein